MARLWLICLENEGDDPDLVAKIEKYQPNKALKYITSFFEKALAFCGTCPTENPSGVWWA